MKKGFFICFLGIDGSGKTTLAKSLVKDLKRNKIESKYLWWLEAENSIIRRFLRFLIPKKEKSKDKYSIKTSKNLTEFPLLGSIYQYIVFIDYLRQGFLKIWIPLIFGKNIICDRYIYDVIISFSIEFNYSQKKFETMLSKFVHLFPEPNLTFLIDIPEEVAFKRKDDIHKFNYLTLQRLTYLDLAKKYEMIIFDGSKELTELKSKIWNEVSKFIIKGRKN